MNALVAAGVEIVGFADGLSTREGLALIEAELAKYPQVPMEVVHHFAPGLYARELHIPAGTILTGKIHRRVHLNVLTQGRISVLTEEGMKTLEAPAVIKSVAGIKRAGIAHTDVIWMTFHPTDETDLDKIEAEHIAPTYEDLDRPMIEVAK